MTKHSFAALALLSLPLAAGAQTTFDFESADQLDSPLVTGSTANYPQEGGIALSGSQSLRFDYSIPDPFQSWTYDMPFTIQNGEIRVWFYDAIGPAAGVAQPDKWGGSIILEDKDNPGQFLAVEVWNGPYPQSGDPTPTAPNYYLTRGNGASPTTFKSRYFGDRSIGFHEVVFTLTPGGSTATLDGVSNSDGTGVVTGPGTSSNLRLRFMAWSATDGGFSNWMTDTTPTVLEIPDSYLYLDDLTITATTPSAQTKTEGFEIVSGTATYDSPAVFMTTAGFDNPQMRNVVPQWNPTTNPTFVHSGTQALSFTNEDPTFKSIAFDLSTASPGNATVWFHDSLGPNEGFDKIGGAIVLEQASNPANFIAAEIWNAPYPASGDPDPSAKNYYLTKGTSGSQATSFRSNYFGNRVVGWNEVTIQLGNSSSKILVNGIENSNGSGIMTGPGLLDGLRLRIMNDSPSCGGFTNYLDPATSELNYLYLSKTAPYLRFDDIVLPIMTASEASQWSAYE